MLNKIEIKTALTIINKKINKLENGKNENSSRLEMLIKTRNDLFKRLEKLGD